MKITCIIEEIAGLSTHYPLNLSLPFKYDEFGHKPVLTYNKKKHTTV